MSEKVMTTVELRDEITRLYCAVGHGTQDHRLYHSMLCTIDDYDACKDYLAAMIDDMNRWAANAPTKDD